MLALAACLGVLAPMSAAAQRVVEIDDEIACDACAIETGPPVTLAPPDELWFSSLSALRVVRDRFVRTPGDDVWVHSLRADEFGGFECIVTPLVLRRG